MFPQCFFISTNLHILIGLVTCAVFCSSHYQNIWEATNLNAVSNFEGIDKYYYSLQRGGHGLIDPPDEPQDPKQKEKLKQEICKKILTSHYFKMYKIDWLDTNRNDVREILRESNEALFYSIFDEYEYESICCLPSFGYGYDYRNASKIRRVRISDDEETDEYVFKCVAIDRASNLVKEYFVSQAYNVNSVGYSYPIAGRFIFSVEKDETLILVAMAEETAIELDEMLPGIYYELWKGSLVDEPELDPVCSLQPAHKLRICCSLLGMPMFENQITFLPTVENVVINCQKKIIRTSYFPSKFSEEWVIGCNAFTRTNDQVTYYVSRGEKANLIYLFREINSKMLMVYKICTNVTGVEKLISAEPTVNNALPRTATIDHDGTQGPRFLQETVED